MLVFFSGSSDNSLSEQLSSSAQTRILRLELENKRLLSTVETLQDNAFHQNNERILELEKQRKKLSLQVSIVLPTLKVTAIITFVYVMHWKWTIFDDTSCSVLRVKAKFMKFFGAITWNTWLRGLYRCVRMLYYVFICLEMSTKKKRWKRDLKGETLRSNKLSRIFS